MLGGIDGLNKGFYFMMDELPRERLGGAIEATAHLEFAFEVTFKCKLTFEHTVYNLAFFASIDY